MNVVSILNSVAYWRQNKRVEVANSKVRVEIQPLLTLQACLHSDDFDCKDYNRALQVDIDSYNKYLEENNISTPSNIELHFCGSGVFAVYTWSK